MAVESAIEKHCEKQDDRGVCFNIKTFTLFVYNLLTVQTERNCRTLENRPDCIRKNLITHDLDRYPALGVENAARLDC